MGRDTGDEETTRLHSSNELLQHDFDELMKEKGQLEKVRYNSNCYSEAYLLD